MMAPHTVLLPAMAAWTPPNRAPIWTPLEPRSRRAPGTAARPCRARSRTPARERLRGVPEVQLSAVQQVVGSPQARCPSHRGKINLVMRLERQVSAAATRAAVLATRRRAGRRAAERRGPRGGSGTPCWRRNRLGPASQGHRPRFASAGPRLRPATRPRFARGPCQERQGPRRSSIGGRDSEGSRLQGAVQGGRRGGRGP
jgi:hypothetical protein